MPLTSQVFSSSDHLLVITFYLPSIYEKKWDEATHPSSHAIRKVVNKRTMLTGLIWKRKWKQMVKLSPKGSVVNWTVITVHWHASCFNQTCNDRCLEWQIFANILVLPPNEVASINCLTFWLISNRSDLSGGKLQCSQISAFTPTYSVITCHRNDDDDDDNYIGIIP